VPQPVITREAGRREWIGLAVLTLPCLLYATDLTVLNLAIPRISSDLRPSSTQLLWIVDVYGFMAAGALVTTPCSRRPARPSPRACMWPSPSAPPRCWAAPSSP